MELIEACELVCNLRSMGQEDLADWVADTAIWDDSSDWENIQAVWDAGER